MSRVISRMHCSTSHQAGFSASVIIIAIAVLAVIGGVGFAVFNKASDEKIAATTSGNPSAAKQQISQPTAKPEESMTKTANVEELGVQFSTPEILADVTYHIEEIELTNGGTGKVAYFSIKRLEQLDRNCAANFGPLGAIQRHPGQYDAGRNDDGSPKFAPLLKQLEGSFVTYEPSRAACVQSQDKAVLAEYTALDDAMRRAIKTVESDR